MRRSGRMAKYIVTEDCYGFRNRYWEKGEVVEIDPQEKPPIHFKLLNAEKDGPRLVGNGGVRAKILEPAPEKKATSENIKSELRPKYENTDKQTKTRLVANGSIRARVNQRRGSGRRLTEKQKNFIKAYLRRLCGTKAVVEAYPEVKNRNTAGVMAYELLRNPKIKKIIDEQFDEGRGNCASNFIDFEITE